MKTQGKKKEDDDMIIVLRILFCLVALFVFWFGSISLGEWIHCHQREEIDGERIMTIAHQIIAVLLAFFFTLWCIKVGLV